MPFPKAPPALWETQPKRGRFLVYIDSQLSSVAITVHPSRPVEDRVLVLGGDVWLRATLRMVGWVNARVDLMLALGEKGQITPAQFEDFQSRIDTIAAWVKESESFDDEALNWTWENRSAQASFKPPFDHYRRKLIGPKKGAGK